MQEVVTPAGILLEVTMPASRHDYNEIARILKGIRGWCLTQRERTMHEAIVERIATHFGDNNPNFLKNKFKEEAGVD